MKICVTATSASFDAPVDPHFGRCLYFVIVDTDSMQFEILKNKTTSASDGAGVQAAQMILNRGVDIVITRFVGSKVFSMLSSNGIDTLLFTTGSVADAIQVYKENSLGKLEAPNSPGQQLYGVQNGIYQSLKGRP